MREKTVRYELADHGQDLLWIDIRGNKIVGAGFGSTNNSVFAGMLSYDFYAQKTLQPGDHIRYSKSPQDHVHTIKYQIVKVTTPAAWNKAIRDRERRLQSKAEVAR